MLELIFPEYVITEESELDSISGEIYPEEYAFIKKAVLK